MIRNIKRALAGTAVMGMAVFGQANAAMQPGEYLNGQWATVPDGNRGITLTYLERTDGSGLLFGAVFSYDDEGEATWLITSTEFLEHQFEAVGVVAAFEGGTFADVPEPGADVTSNLIGNTTVTLNSCGNIEFNFDFDADSGFEDVSWNLQPAGAPFGFENDECVYKNEFTGCPSFATEVTVGIGRACALSGVIRNQDITLTNDTTWQLNGLVQIGDDNANQSSVTIEPGTTLVGAGGIADYLYVNPGSKIFAEGRPNAPIVLTTANDGFVEGTQPQPGDVGGLVVSGNAPCNSSPDENLCFSEFDPTLRYGGDDPNDSSGIIKYWQVRYGGFEFQPNREVNAFTMQAVGNGTVISHLQSYANLDDAIEFFGGTANARYIVGTAGNDDGFDWDEGWSGKVQYGLMLYTDASNGDHGFESANNPDNDDALPRATPRLSNITLIGAAGTGDGIRYKEGTAGQTWNSVVTGFEANCIRFVDLPTYAAAGGLNDFPNNITGDTAIAGTIIGNCGSLFRTEDGAPFTVDDFFAAFPGNEIIEDLELVDGFMPPAGSPALEGGLRVIDLNSGEPDQFFDFVPYRGAFDGVNDWTAGWTHDILGENAFETE